MSRVQIVPLSRRRRDVLRFLKVSYGIYRNDPHWVAPLLFDLQKVFLDGNPFLDHAEMQLWVAEREGQDVGRVAGILDHRYVELQHDPAAFFGFFESQNDPAVCRALVEAAAGWARQRGAERLLGPMNPSSNDECGLLVEGFDSPAVLMMPYNPPYYADLLLAEGFLKAKDLLAYWIDLATAQFERLGAIAEKCRRRNPELTFRPVRRQTLTTDLAKIKEVYNAAWEHNWGFVPMTDAEINFMAARLRPLLVEGLVWLVESPTEPVGFLLAIPDFNEAFKPLCGRLASPRLLRLVPYALGWKTPAVCRVIILGVKEGYRARGLEAVMLVEGLKVGARLGFRAAEASWVLEDNVKMRRVIEAFGARVYKVYRLFERRLQQ
jgi:GNAT superfamily N-acetyltransferase